LYLIIYKISLTFSIPILACFWWKFCYPAPTLKLEGFSKSQVKDAFKAAFDDIKKLNEENIKIINEKAAFEKEMIKRRKQQEINEMRYLFSSRMF
jgi:hypothetical protein